MSRLAFAIRRVALPPSDLDNAQADPVGELGVRLGVVEGVGVALPVRWRPRPGGPPRATPSSLNCLGSPEVTPNGLLTRRLTLPRRGGYYLRYVSLGLQRGQRPASRPEIQSSGGLAAFARARTTMESATLGIRENRVDRPCPPPRRPLDHAKSSFLSVTWASRAGRPRWSFCNRSR